MKKILLLENQPIETYNGISFVQSIILAYNNLRDELYNSYINLVCNCKDDLVSFGLTFLDVTWEDFRLRGLIHMDIYNISNIKKGHICDFIKERIDSDNYILIFSIDEFYLPYSDFYQKKHYIHDTYIYGYEDDVFLVMAYTSKKKLERIKIKKDTIESGLYNLWENNKNLGFCTLQVNNSINRKFDIKIINSSLKNYLNGMDNKGNPSSGNIAYGVRIYNIIEAFLNNCLISKTVIDIRPYRVLWEHKKVMKLRVKKISEVFNLSVKYQIEIEEIERKTNILFVIIMKYISTYDTELIQRALTMLNEIKQKEKFLIENIIYITSNK